MPGGSHRGLSAHIVGPEEQDANRTSQERDADVPAFVPEGQATTVLSLNLLWTYLRRTGIRPLTFGKHNAADFFHIRAQIPQSGCQ